MDTVLKFYSLLRKEKKKERFDIILEPLQAVIQLALLSFYPKGTKLTIANNLLSIQSPTWTQGMWRSYNQDVKEDLFFLFNTIMRFNLFYAFIKDDQDEYCDLFDLLVQLGKRGIDKLLLTYSTTEQPALLHTLQMYRTLLDHPEFLPDNKVHKSHKGSTNVKNKAESAPSSSKHNTVAAESKHNTVAATVVESAPSSSKHNAVAAESKHTAAAVAGENKQNIDDIFIKIRNLYTTHEYIIIYQTLMLLEKNPENYEAYVQGLNLIFSPKAEQIQKWINDNIVY
jgi:hypothetical protein